MRACSPGGSDRRLDGPRRCTGANAYVVSQFKQSARKSSKAREAHAQSTQLSNLWELQLDVN